MIHKICINFGSNVLSILGRLILLIGLLIPGQFGCSGIDQMPGTCLVPDVTNRTVPEAEMLLRQEGFYLREVFGSGSVVLKQHPKAWDTVFCGTYIDVWLQTEPLGEEPGGTDDDTYAPFTGTFVYYQDVNNRTVSHILKLVQKGNSITGTLEIILDDSYYDCCQTTATSQITGEVKGTTATLTFAGLEESCFCRNKTTWGDEDGIYDEISYSVASGYTVQYTLESSGNILKEHCDDQGTCARKCTIKRSGVPQKHYCPKWCPLEYSRK